MSIKKVIMVGIVAMVAVATFAAEIRNVKAFQQYPWSGKVYISHEMVIDDVVRTGSGKVSFRFVPEKEDQQFIRSHRRADA